MRMASVRGTARRCRKIASVLGVAEYRRALIYGVAASSEHHRTPFRHEFRTVLDVGANRGQFALFAAHRFPRATLLSFEPLPGARARLCRVLRHHPALRTYDVALSSEPGQRVFNVARDDDSSSCLSPTLAQLNAFPASLAVAQIPVRTARLADELADVELARPILLKVDVQGMELEVLRGAGDRLNEIDTVLVECSFVELFAGQALANEVVSFLQARQFRFASICSPVWDGMGRCIQADLVFERASPLDGWGSDGGSRPLETFATASNHEAAD